MSFERALIAAIYEVVERDAVSIAWRQQLPLPRIEVEAIPAPLVPFWERLIAASSDVEYLFFDATFDLGIPTVYGLQVARYNRRVTTTVHCATAASAAVALSKVIRDMAASKIGFRNPQPVPDDCDDFVEAHHGATYMARAENAVAFQFLTESRGSKRLSTQIRNYGDVFLAASGRRSEAFATKLGQKGLKIATCERPLKG